MGSVCHITGGWQHSGGLGGELGDEAGLGRHQLRLVPAARSGPHGGTVGNSGE